jgi:hypothetical protein
LGVGSRRFHFDHRLSHRFSRRFFADSRLPIPDSRILSH